MEERDGQSLGQVYYLLALGAAIDKTDMTGFLRKLLADGCRIGAVPVHGAWCEVDSDSDLNAYETALAEGDFSHDWR